jgi:stage V sporulation protein R
MATRELIRALSDLNLEIRNKALGYGLDPFNVAFEVVTFDQMNELAAFEGFPIRYPHWRFGMEYERLRRSYAYGLHVIYEMVINNDPCYAYLLEHNKLVDHKVVMAHVYAHSDFFKNNLWFSHTDRRMLDEMANHGTRVRRYVDKYGAEEVEQFLDTCLSIDDLIDPNAAFDRDLPISLHTDEDEPVQLSRFRAKSYMDPFVNPQDVLNAERAEKEKQAEQKRFPAEPQRDVLLFLLGHAPLKPWQIDVLAMIREESYYFLPQRQTKIMNEGWAAYWHSKIMTESGVMEPSEVVDYADHNAGTLAINPGHLNPYKLGVELFRHIEKCWNTGRFGTEWESCTDMAQRREWDRNLGQGRAKMFEVRRVYNDLGFIDTFMDREFALESKFFVFAEKESGGETRYEIISREFDRIKSNLLFQLTNGGRPIIWVQDANVRNRGELMLRHQHEGLDLDQGYARDTLAAIQRLWGRPVHITTIKNEKPVIHSPQTAGVVPRVTMRPRQQSWAEYRPKGGILVNHAAY